MLIRREAVEFGVCLGRTAHRMSSGLVVLNLDLGTPSLAMQYLLLGNLCDGENIDDVSYHIPWIGYIIFGKVG